MTSDIMNSLAHCGHLASDSCYFPSHHEQFGWKVGSERDVGEVSWLWDFPEPVTGRWALKISRRRRKHWHGPDSEAGEHWSGSWGCAENKESYGSRVTLHTTGGRPTLDLQAGQGPAELPVNLKAGKPAP